MINQFTDRAKTISLAFIPTIILNQGIKKVEINITETNTIKYRFAGFFLFVTFLLIVIILWIIRHPFN